MFAAGAFILCCVLAVQGIAGQLPRPVFLRVSSVLQLTAFCLFLMVYLLQPALATPESIASPQNQALLGWLPSYWFLGLFEQLNGSPGGSAHAELMALASRAWIALGLAVATTGAAFLFSYVRTLRRIVEQPDIVAGTRRLNWLPRFGNSMETVVTRFCIRSLSRSRQHRVCFRFIRESALPLPFCFCGRRSGGNSRRRRQLIHGIE